VRLGRGERAVPAADGGHGRAGLRDERRRPRQRAEPGRVRRGGGEAEPAAQEDPGLPAPAGGGQDASRAIHFAAGESSPTTGPRPYAQDRCWAIAPSALRPVAADCAFLRPDKSSSVNNVIE
jgi:hypothetical protein